MRTFLDPGTAVTGKLSFSNPTRIAGRLRGEVRATDLLIVAPEGVLHGTVRPTTLVVAGEVRGEILGAERVEIQRGGRVAGLVEARTLVVEEGGILEGDVHMADTPEDVRRPAQG